MKSIYKAPIVDQLKDLKRACEIALDFIDTMPLRNIDSKDMKRQGLREGEFALCDWIVRPRFEEITNSSYDCSRDAETFPVTFENWWNDLNPAYGGRDRRVGNPLKNGGYFTISRECALAIWESMGLSVSSS